jgi:hypothetical protein
MESGGIRLDCLDDSVTLDAIYADVELNLPSGIIQV